MDKKQEAIELLKKETTDLANVYKEDGGFVLSGTYRTEKEETYNKEQREIKDIKEIKVGDYFIARRPKQDAVLGWISVMDKFDGVIQECGLIDERGYILSKTTFMDMWYYLPEWCEKVYPGDVMKTGYGDLIIFKEFKNGKMYHYAFCSHDDGEIYIEQKVPIFSQPQLHISPTTPEEAKPLFDALAKSGKKWNKEKLQIEDIYVDGNFYVSKMGNAFIYRETDKVRATYYAFVNLDDVSEFDIDPIMYCGRINDATPATIEQKNVLIDALMSRGEKWNSYKKCIEDIKWEPKPGDVCANKYGNIFIYKREPLISTDGFIEFYAALYQDISIFGVNGMALCDEIRLATYEERCVFFERLVKEGYKWDAKKLKLTKVEKKHTEEKWEPKDGEFVTNTFDGGGRTISIFCRHCPPKPYRSNPTFLAYCGLAARNTLFFDAKFVVQKMTKSTPAEIKQLTDALEKQGKRWNADKKCIDDIPKTNADEGALRALGYSIEEAKDFKAYREKYVMAVEELQNTSKEYMASVKEAIVELKSDNRTEYLKTMADLYAASSQSGKRDALKQVIKLCKQLLNEK